MRMTFSFSMLLVLLSLVHSNIEAQTKQPLRARVCEILANPSRFDGKIIAVRAKFRPTFEWSAIEDEGCEDRILVVNPIHSSITPRPAFRLQQDNAWREFDRLSEERLPSEPNSICLGPCGAFKNWVVATFVGRLESAHFKAGGKSKQQAGYGHLGQFPVRLVLKSVSDVVATPRSESE